MGGPGDGETDRERIPVLEQCRESGMALASSQDKRSSSKVGGGLWERLLEGGDYVLEFGGLLGVRTSAILPFNPGEA